MGMDLIKIDSSIEYGTKKILILLLYVLLKNKKVSSSFILTGNSGTGKTYIIQLLFRILNRIIPVYKINAFESLVNNDFTENIISSFRKCIGIKYYYFCQILIGQIIDIEYASSKNLNNGFLILKSRDMESFFYIGQNFSDKILNLDLQVGDVLYYSKTNGILRKYRNSTY